jgi:hypothetical protein
MSRKVYLDWQQVQTFWENEHRDWEDIYILISSGGSSYYKENPWDKPWNKPSWHSLTQQEKDKILNHHRKRS